MEPERYIQELSKCVRCGTCKASCFTYDEDATESMGARGRLALLRGLATGILQPSSLLNDRIFSCTLCGACSGLCPLGVDINEVMYRGRNILRKTDRKRQYLRLFLSAFIRNPKLTFQLMKMGQNFMLPYLRKKNLLPLQFNLPEHHLKENVQVVPVAKKRGRVAVFTGCTVNFLYPHLGEALINVLHGLGYEVILPAGEICCGVPLRTLGLEEEAKRLAKKNLDAFSRLHVESVVCLCPTCTHALKSEYPKMIGEGIEKASDISSFFVDKLASSQFSKLTSFPNPAGYHDPCHLKYGLGITREPREILRILGIDLLDSREELCCGFAGMFCFSNRELSRNLLTKCAHEYAHAEVLVTSCPGCILQLSKDIRNKPVLHLIEVIEEALIQ
ncbi:MAG: (Fe-S)-binding protein [Thermodesulfovibrionales bacterium]|nr:(Fe-S)-binding protein [Thermodesulfovibrionales bacterium]